MKHLACQGLKESAGRLAFQRIGQASLWTPQEPARQRLLAQFCIDTASAFHVHYDCLRRIRHSSGAGVRLNHGLRSSIADSGALGATERQVWWRSRFSLHLPSQSSSRLKAQSPACNEPATARLIRGVWASQTLEFNIGSELNLPFGHAKPCVSNNARVSET